MDDQHDQHFNLILNKYQDAANEDVDIVALTDLMHEHNDKPPLELPEEILEEFKNIINRIVPGRVATHFFNMINDMRSGIEVETDEWVKKLSPLEVNLVVTILMYTMVRLYDKDISDEYKTQIKNYIMMFSMFIKNDSNSCCIL